VTRQAYIFTATDARLNTKILSKHDWFKPTVHDERSRCSEREEIKENLYAVGFINAQKTILYLHFKLEVITQNVGEWSK